MSKFLKEAQRHISSLLDDGLNHGSVYVIQAQITLAELEHTELQAENAQLRGEKPIPEAWWSECPALAQRTMERIIESNDQLQAELKSLKEFGCFVIKDMCFGCDLLDGGDVQEVAEKLGLIKPVKATEDDVDEESDFEVGDIIYKFTEILKGGER